MKKIALLSAMLLCVMLSWAANAPKYIFYFIGDGMGNGPLMASQTYLRMVVDPDSTLNMLQLPVASQASTYSASTPVTDSAAAGTALSTGHKTVNGMLGVTPDSLPVTSIAKILFDNGYGVGLVTTVAPDDATPGAFYAHVPSRSMYYEIGHQFADCGYQFLAGSSLRGATDKKGNPTDLIPYIKSKGIDIAYGLGELPQATSDRVILLEPTPFNNSNVGYTIDGTEGRLTLAQMTDAALAHLQRVSPDAFFLMVEGGNIDHSLHGNDAATAIVETLNFDATLRKAIDFYLAHPDETLIVVTADHDTGGISIGNNTSGYNAYPDMLSHSRISKDCLSIVCNRAIADGSITTWEQARQLLSDYLGLFTEVPLDEEREARLQEIFDRIFVKKIPATQNTLYSSINEFAAVAVDMLNDVAGFGWTTLNHTGNTVPVFAAGAGSEHFNSFTDNTDIPKRILKATGLSAGQP